METNSGRHSGDQPGGKPGRTPLSCLNRFRDTLGATVLVLYAKSGLGSICRPLLWAGPSGPIRQGLYPVVAREARLPADFLAQGKWVSLPASALGSFPEPTRVWVAPVRAARPEPFVLAVFDPPAEAAELPVPPSFGVSRAGKWVAQTWLARRERADTGELLTPALARLRQAFFQKPSFLDAVNGFLAEFARASGLTGARLFLQSGSGEFKTIFSSWDDPALLVAEKLHMILRKAMDAGKAVLNADHPALAELAPGLKACFLRLDAPPYQAHFLGVTRSEVPWPMGLAIALKRGVRLMLAFQREVHQLENQLRDLVIQRDTEQVILELMVLRGQEEFHRCLPELVKDYLGVENVACYFRVRGDHLCRHAWAGPAATAQTPWEYFKFNPNTLLGGCFKSGKAILKPDLGRIDHRRLEDGLIAEAVLYFPLMERGKATAVLVAADSHSGGINFAHLHRLARLSPFLDQAARNNRLYAQAMQLFHLDLETGLLNRRGFEARLEVQLDRIKHGGEPFSLLMASLDRPDRLRLDSAGLSPHLFLSRLSRFFMDVLPPGAVLAHLGEQTFMFLVTGYELENALKLARKVCARCREVLWEAEVLPTLSIGVSSCPINGLGLDELMLSAEQAMTVSRFQGGDMASIMGSQVIKQLAIKVVSGFIGKPHLETGPELVDGVLQRLSEPNELSGSLTVLEMINSLAEAIDAKDSYTKNHTLETSLYSVVLGRRMGLDEKTLERLRIAAKLHDIGKIGIPESILCKKGKLSQEESLVMRRHPELGARILRPIASLHHISVIVEHHHEWWDGTGYPHQLKGEEIPVESRVLAVIDSYHAMISRRSYREPLKLEEALAEIERAAGSQFDPYVACLFVSMMREKENPLNVSASSDTTV